LAASVNDVENFLKRFKGKMDAFGIYFPGRMKNIKSRSEREITIDQLRDTLRNIEVSNYHKGPIKNMDDSAEPIWIFGADINGTEYYIKLTLGIENNMVGCISFHEAENTLNYPHKEG